MNEIMAVHFMLSPSGLQQVDTSPLTKRAFVHGLKIGWKSSWTIDFETDIHDRRFVDMFL